MKKHRLFTLIAIASVMLACNLPMVAPQQGQAPASETPLSGTTPITPPLTPTETQPAATPTDTLTPTPTDTPTITPTLTPSVPMVTPLKDPVNCRFGPGTEYSIVGALQVGSNVAILGKTPDGGWWLIQNPLAPGGNCWVGGSVTIASGDLTKVGVVAAPATFVTKVTIKTDPTTIEVPGCVFPVTISYEGTITVNGPVKVKWHWELSQGVSSPTDTINFTAFGDKTLEDNYHVGAEGDYWVRLVVTSPNSMVAEAKYTAVCS